MSVKHRNSNLMGLLVLPHDPTEFPLSISSQSSNHSFFLSLKLCNSLTPPPYLHTMKTKAIFKVLHTKTALLSSGIPIYSAFPSVKEEELYYTSSSFLSWLDSTTSFPLQNIALAIIRLCLNSSTLPCYRRYMYIYLWFFNSGLGCVAALMCSLAAHAAVTWQINWSWKSSMTSFLCLVS